jgi:hypothetical protein
MTRAERLILENQKLIMSAISVVIWKLVTAPGVGSDAEERPMRTELTTRISLTQDAIERAKTWQED